MVKDIGNGFVVKELAAKEYFDNIDPHFVVVYANRANEHQPIELDENTKQKQSARAQVARFQLRLVVFKNEQVVGWHHGYEKDPETYYMQNSAILEAYRNQGIYGKLLEVVLERAKEEGFQVITSTHHPHNAAVLIPKLKRGFFIAGMQFHERFRSLIEMKYVFHEQRRKNYFKTMGLEL